MEKRVTFKGWLAAAWLLIAPQVVITAVFFFYPGGQAIWQSLFIPDPFGLSMQFVGLGNFEFLLSDPFYRASFLTTAVFSTLVTVVSMGRRCSGGAGRPADQGLGHLPHAADLALCRRAGGGRCAVAVHVQHPRRRGDLVSRPAWL
jgi:hypothetical protein